MVSRKGFLGIITSCFRPNTSQLNEIGLKEHLFHLNLGNKTLLFWIITLLLRLEHFLVWVEMCSFNKKVLILFLSMNYSWKKHNFDNFLTTWVDGWWHKDRKFISKDKMWNLKVKRAIQLKRILILILLKLVQT